MKEKYLGLLLASCLLVGCGSESVKVNPTGEPVALEETSKVIVALGDSLTEGYGLERDQAYPAQLQQVLKDKGHTDYKVVNSGLSGETSTGLLQRINWVFKQNPDLIILTIGANDAIRGIDLSLTEKNIRTIVETIQERGIPLIFSGMEIYDNLGPEYVAEFKAMYPKIAADYELPFIPFFLEGVGGNPELNIEDRIHPNPEGYAKIVQNNIMPVLEPLLN